MVFNIVQDGRAKCEFGEVALSHEPWCEHCQQLEPYDATFASEGTWWCRWCLESLGIDIDEKALEPIIVAERAAKIKYHTRALEDLKNG